MYKAHCFCISNNLYVLFHHRQDIYSLLSESFWYHRLQGRWVIPSLWVQDKLITERRGKDCIRNAGSSSFSSTLAQTGGGVPGWNWEEKKGGIWEYSLSSPRSTTHNWRRTRAPGIKETLNGLILEREGFLLTTRRRRKGSRDTRQLWGAVGRKQRT